MRNPPARPKPIIARGPEMIFKPGTWQAEHYRDRPMHEQVRPGQYFPEGATQKQLDVLAQRRSELSVTAAVQATSTVVELELPEEPAPKPQVPAEHEAAAA